MRIEAATGLRWIIEESSEEQLANFVPIIPQLLETYFGLMAEMGLSDVIEALQVIIGKFGEQVAPHAHTLVGHLSQAFQRYAMAEGDDESAFAAMNCLDAISALLDALSTAEEEEDDEDDSTTEADYRAKGVAEAAAAAANPNAPPKPSNRGRVPGHRAALRPAALVGPQRRQSAGHRVH